MTGPKLEAYFFTSIFLAALLIVGLVFYPFIGSIALAVVLASLVAPFSAYMQKKIKNKVKNNPNDPTKIPISKIVGV